MAMSSIAAEPVSELLISFKKKWTAEKKTINEEAEDVDSNGLFRMKITVSVTKSSHQEHGPCYLHLPIFFLIHTLSSSLAK